MKRSLKTILKKAFAALVIFPLGTAWNFYLYLGYLAFRLRSLLGLARLKTHDSAVNRRTEKVCVFAFHQKNRLSPTLLIHLRAVRDQGYSILAISNGPLAKSDRDTLLELCFRVVERENFGRDFGAYKLGVLEALEHENLERLLLTNDSVYCPLHPLGPVTESMEAQDNDFWGLNDNWEHKYHIASFYLVFKPAAFRHPVFRRFWRRYRPLSSRRHSIHRGEVKLTNGLVRAGLRPGVFSNSAALVERINGLDLTELYALVLNMSDQPDRSLAHFVSEYLELLEANLNAPNDSIFVNTVRTRIAKELSSQLERSSPPHWAALALNHYLRYPLFKKDVVFRGCYDFGFSVANLRTTTDFPLDLIEIETRAKGSGRNLNLFKRVLMIRGYL